MRCPVCYHAQTSRLFSKKETITGSLEQFHSDRQFDLISMIQVVAHFSDVHQAIQQARAMTKPNGLVLIETWDSDSWLVKLSKSQWHEYNPRSVLHFFSAAGLDHLMSQHGLSKIPMRRPVKRISGKHARSVLCYNLKNSTIEKIEKRLMALIPDRLRLSYPAVDLFWALFKKCR